MSEIRRILVPVDFSECSRRALEDAIVLAKKFGADLHLVHCYEVYPYGVIGFPGIAMPPSLERDIRQAASAHLASWRDKASAQGVGAEQHLVVERPSAGIVALAEKLPADLIVIGTHGFTGLAHALIGSVAERTVRHAPCPVWTVCAGDTRP